MTILYIDKKGNTLEEMKNQSVIPSIGSEVLLHYDYNMHKVKRVSHFTDFVVIHI